ncbi:putative ABC-type ATPase [Pedobacter sp. UYP30]|uniref:zeta toxin family protein n=1 Tax=Pedobacter sp. UYP30 TaxID=1756400 RepID=UPI0033908F51
MATHHIFDGDLLYTKKLKELFPAITRSAKYARKEALEYVVDLFHKQTKKALRTNDHYIYEGHFTNHETWNTPKAFAAAGYHVHLIFFGLENPNLSQFRVTERTSEGGHYVDPITLENNFYGNLEKLDVYHKMIDDLIIIDTSEINHRILFKKVNQSIEFSVRPEALPDWFTQNLPDITTLISEDDHLNDKLA